MTSGQIDPARSRFSIQRSNPNLAPLHGELACPFDSMYLQSYEALGIGLVHVLAHEVLDQVSIDPGLHSRPFGNQANAIPTLGDKVIVTVTALFLGRKPARSQCFAV